MREIIDFREHIICKCRMTIDFRDSEGRDTWDKVDKKGQCLDNIAQVTVIGGVEDNSRHCYQNTIFRYTSNFRNLIIGQPWPHWNVIRDPDKWSYMRIGNCHKSTSSLFGSCLFVVSVLCFQKGNPVTVLQYSAECILEIYFECSSTIVESAHSDHYCKHQHRHLSSFNQ